MTAEICKRVTCGHDKHLHDMESAGKQCWLCKSPPFCNNYIPQEGLESTKQETSSTNSKSQLQPQSQLQENLDTEIRLIREEFRTYFTRCDELIRRLGNAIEKAGIIKQVDICHEIKSILAEEIADKKITTRTIDRCCPDEWKHSTKPKGKKDILSFSNQQTAIKSKAQPGTSRKNIVTPAADQLEKQPIMIDTNGQVLDPSTPNQQMKSPPSDERSVVKESPQPLPQHNQSIEILIDWHEMSDKMADLHYKDIKNFWLCGQIDSSGKLLNMELKRGVWTETEVMTA